MGHVDVWVYKDIYVYLSINTQTQAHTHTHTHMFRRPHKRMRTRIQHTVWGHVYSTQYTDTYTAHDIHVCAVCLADLFNTCMHCAHVYITWIYIYTHTHMYIHTYIIYIYLCIYTYNTYLDTCNILHIYIHTHTHTHTHTHVYALAHTVRGQVYSIAWHGDQIKKIAVCLSGDFIEKEKNRTFIMPHIHHAAGRTTRVRGQ